ncbi:MAG TPA: hypothetical protein VGG25_08225 [Streptosporangiaceae bacterium]|jgi:hypothetical protein
MSHHNAAMLLAPAKPHPAVKSFHLLGLHHHFTGPQAGGLFVVLFALAVAVWLIAIALRDRAAE